MGCVQKVGSRWQIRAFAGEFDLTTLTSLEIAYEDPNGGTGVLSATVDATDSRFCTGDFTHLIGTIAGTWSFEITGNDAGGNPVVSYETAKVELKARYA